MTDSFLSLPLHAHLSADQLQAFPMADLNRVVAHWHDQGVYVTDVTVQPEVFKAWQDEIRSGLIRKKLTLTDPDMVARLDEALKQFDVVRASPGPRLFKTQVGAVQIHLTTDGQDG
ncbi:hypothetical protein FF100_22120 [Methylobacterium terricola]|uniref:Uncharacterized protein n=1 Tax=Methylobacterium terricola TaxID=2583531 RepID=A0A5C4LCV1_9HYPH|nr:hypothetical protein [Methylobacterium terricola]TNC10850.1 hypothetical protein FF100_22120 [Methylobacterium terricola]